MARSSFSTTSFPRRNYDSVKSWFIIPASFVLVVYFYIFFYASSTLKLVIQPHHTHLFITPKLSSSFNNYTSSSVLIKPDIIQIIADEDHRLNVVNNHSEALSSTVADHHGGTHHDERNVSEISGESQRSRNVQEITNASSAFENKSQNEDVFHDREMFLEDYKQMNRSLRIFVYPHKSNDPFANVLLPVNYEPGGNYASESYFKKALMTSHFITKNPSQAHLFFLPFSIASLRHDKRIGVGGVKDFIKNYINDISHRYPYWNRTGGADHFYVACHSIGRTAMEKATQVRDNAIQLVCSSNYFLQGYIGHKDASVPQIWPRQGEPPNNPPSKRKKLAFYAGAMNSRVRESLVKLWKDDPEISVHQNRLKTPYNKSLLGSRFCIHAKGFEVNTARIGDALYYGCVPVILADHYDLPFADILNWNTFSVVVATVDIPDLKRILKAIKFDEYVELQKKVMKVRNHFQWHTVAVDYDAFYMVMYELWLRRSSVSVSFVGYQQKMRIQ